MSTTHVMTADDLWKMRDDGNRHELVNGELRTMSPSGAEHGYIVVKVTTALDQFATSRRLGIVLGAETGFKLTHAPDTVRAPDVAFVGQERIPESGIPKAFWPTPPNLAVEVISPGDTVKEVDEKVNDWLNAGTEVVWVVKPTRRTVTVYRAPDVIQILSEGDEIDGGETLPGFRCRVSDLFPR